MRIPHVASPKGRRIEVRFPDSNGNSYFIFTALMMAGLDGIRNKIEPGAPMEVNYRLWLQEGEMTVEQAAALSTDFVEPLQVVLQ